MKFLVIELISGRKATMQNKVTFNPDKNSLGSGIKI